MSRPVPGLILAGGQARRMGGGQKGLILLGGQMLIARAAARLGAQAGPLALSANGDPALFSEFDLPVLPDPMPGFPGPLAGVLSGLDWAADLGAEALVTAPCDTPFFPKDLVARLVAAGPFAMAASTAGAEPAFGVWSVSLRGALRAALEAGRRKVIDFAESQGVTYVTFPQAEAFFNINSPEDLARAEAMLR